MGGRTVRIPSTVVCATAALASVCIAPPCRADADGPRGFEVGLRLGYSKSAGSISAPSGDPTSNQSDLSSYISSAYPIWVDLGYRVNGHFMVGGYLSLGVGSASNCDTQASCSVSQTTLGVQGQYHFTPSADVDPWIGLGIGWESFKFSETFSAPVDGVGGVTSTVTGPVFVLAQAGVDWKVMSNLGLGPFVAASVGRYTSTSDGIQSQSIDQTALHEWFTIGVRGAFDTVP
ncbi:MAG: outer membrane beta-barrel protein [Polyangiales bacterium]